MPKQAKDFVFSGKETFKVGSEESKKKKTPESVVLNIDEDDALLSKNAKKLFGRDTGVQLESTGFFLFDWFKTLNRYFVTLSSLKDEDKANFFHLLAVMVNSGVPVIKSLKSLIGQVKADSHMHILIKDLLERVEGGQSLSEAMSYHPQEFSDMEIGMIEAGEASGHLNKTLHNLASDISRRKEIKHKIKSALIYPTAIIGLLIIVLIAMMVFVIPRLKALFDRSGDELPAITRGVIWLSDLLNNHGLLLLAGVLVLVLFVVFGKKTEGGRFIWDKMKINMPLFGKLFKKTYLARFARSLSSLLGSGVPIIKSIEITSSAIGNDVYKRKIYLAGEDMKQGIPLAENLSDQKLFPPMIVNMVEVGEKTAQLDEILQKVAKFYEEEVSTSVAGIAKIIEPAVLILIGVSVGLIAAAVMLPIMQLSDMAGAL